MKNLFVPYELALKLKEKGFNEPCLMVYESKDSLIPESEAGSNHTNVDAPLYQQVQDWFREKHGILLDIDFGLGWGYGFIPVGCSIKLPTDYKEGSPQWNYYEALTKAIEEAIKLI